MYLPGSFKLFSNPIFENPIPKFSLRCSIVNIRVLYNFLSLRFHFLCAERGLWDYNVYVPTSFHPSVLPPPTNPDPYNFENNWRISINSGLVVRSVGFLPLDTFSCNILFSSSFPTKRYRFVTNKWPEPTVCLSLFEIPSIHAC